MSIEVYVVDAFTDRLFAGNPAAVCLLEESLEPDLMQKIAMENNLSETAFIVKTEQGYHIRWFTPAVEVALCGHATLAAAFVIFNYLEKSAQQITFTSKSGVLKVVRSGEWLILDFPKVSYQSCPENLLINEALGLNCTELYKSEDYMIILESEAQIRVLQPKLEIIAALPSRGLVVTAKGLQADFVSRWFGPQVGVNEDPVTGSAHCMLAPYWAEKLGKSQLYAEQLSARLGKVHCEVKADRVYLKGQAVLYMQGRLNLDRD
ncbi:MAG: PhzF family phenazine biosynthesis protein [Gammaproteobacteria bacterium]|nr:PhzF family phenazine biosynthesis protein [Gammaproteobacteria bacterium]